MQLSRFEIIQEGNLRQLIADFYEGIKHDNIIRPMYPDDLAPAEERLFLFMMQFLGGPKIYHEKRGLPALKKRHFPFPINQEARDRWMIHMLSAIEKNNMPNPEKEYLKEYFDSTATFLLNR
jgi:hemoglobin